MSYPRSGIEYCDARSNVWSNVQFSTYNSLQVADFSNVKYFEQQPDSDSEDDVDDEGKIFQSLTLHTCRLPTLVHLLCLRFTVEIYTKKTKCTSDD